jgi:hypothetical protein
VNAGNVKATVLLPAIETVPAPSRSDKNNGAGAVALVVLPSVTFVVADV